MKTTALLVFLFFTIGLTAQNSPPFSIGSVKAAPGEKATGKLIIEKGVDQGTFLPITIINGAKPGPVLTLNAGMHGTEYVPIIALQKLSGMIDPKELSGTLVLIHIANVPAFQAWQVYINPVDNKNLNRSFPGKKDGTLSERIAYTITNEIITKSNYFIDLHGGEFNERIVEYIFFNDGCKDADFCQKCLTLALAMGNKYLIPYNYSAQADSLPSKYAEAEALRQGVVAVTNEWGDRGIALPEEVDHATKNLINTIRTIGMLEGETFINEHPIFLLNETAVNSNYNGILYTLGERGQYVTKGTLLAYATDYWGNKLEEYHAPFTGIISVIKVSPSVRKGDWVFRVAEPKEKLNE